MWIALNDAFLSIVRHTEPGISQDRLQVRARKAGDIEAVFPDAKVRKTPDRDYAYRAFIDEAVVAETLFQRAMSIDYTNFKDSVRSTERHDAYLDMWRVAMRFQNGGYVRRQPRGHWWSDQDPPPAGLLDDDPLAAHLANSSPECEECDGTLVAADGEPCSQCAGHLVEGA